MVIWVTQMLSVWIVSKQKWRGVDMTLSFMSVVRPVGEVGTGSLSWFYSPDRVGLYVIHKQKIVNCLLSWTSLSTRESQLTEAYDIRKSLDLSSHIFFVNFSCQKFDNFAIFDVVCIFGYISVRVLSRRFQHPTNGQTFGFVFFTFWINSFRNPSQARPSRALMLGLMREENQNTMRKPSCKIEIYRNWDGYFVSLIPLERYGTGITDGQPSSF